MPTMVTDLINDVITELSQVPSIAVQIYAAPRIRLFLYNASMQEINELWWPAYMRTLTVAIDDAGMLQSDVFGIISPCGDYSDVQAVFPQGSNRKLRELPQSINPNLLGSGKPYYITPDYTYNARPFRVVPGQAGNVDVRFRQHDLPFNEASQTYMDRLLMIYDACWMYAVDDGTVPAQVQKYQMLAANRRKRLKAAYAQQPLELDPRFPSGEVLDGVDDSFFQVDLDPLA